MSDETDRRTILLLVAIVALHFAIRLILFSGLQAGDDLVYSEHVQNLLTGSGFSLSTNFECRLGFILPLALFRLLFGVNAPALAAFNALCSAGTTIVAFAVGKLLFNRVIGILAALAAAIFPLNVVYSTDARPDVPAAFFLGLGLYYFLRADRGGRRLDLVWAGAWIFCAYLIKEIAIFGAAVIGFWMVAQRAFKRRYLTPAGVFLAGLILEGLVYLVWTGDFLRRFHVIQGEQGAYARTYAATTAQILERAFLAEPKLLFNPIGVGAPFVLFFPAATVLVAVWASCRWRTLSEFREIRMLFLWWLAIYLCLSFWPLKIYPYVPAMRLQMRMLEPLTIPMMVSFGYAVFRVSQWRPRLGICLCSVVVVVCLASSWILYRDARRHTDGAALAYEHLKTTIGARPGVRVYTDGRTRNLFLFWDRYAPRYEYLIGPDLPAAELQPGYVVSNPALIQLAREDHPIPNYLERPPASWHVSAFQLPGRPRLRHLLTGATPPPDEIRIYIIP